MILPPLPFPFVPEQTVIDGRYLVKGTVGRERGGMGLIYIVSEDGLDRRSVLKMLLPELHPEFHKKVDSEGKPPVDARELLKNEAKVGAALVLRYGNDSFAQVFTHGSLRASVTTRKGRTVELDLPWFVMEFLPGLSFMAVIQHFKERETPMPLPMVLTLAAQAAHALSLIHELGYVHRDVKPGNIYLHERVGRSSIVKIIDLGVIQLVGEICLYGTGTTKYTAPEILLGTSARESAQSDIYSLALVVYELAALRGPYEASSKKEWKLAHAYGIPPLLSDFRKDAPRALTQLLAAALDSNANARPDARQFADALALILKQTKGTAADDQVAEILKTLAVRGAHRPPSARTRSSSARSNQALTAPPVAQRDSLPSSESVFFSRKRRSRVNTDSASSLQVEVPSSVASVASSADAIGSEIRPMVAQLSAVTPPSSVADTTPDAPLPFPEARSAARDSYSQISEAEISSQIVGMTNMPVIRSMADAHAGLHLRDEMDESTSDRSPPPLAWPTPRPNSEIARRTLHAAPSEAVARKEIPAPIPSSRERRKPVQWRAVSRDAAWAVAFIVSVTVAIIQLRHWPSPIVESVSPNHDASAQGATMKPELVTLENDASSVATAPLDTARRAEGVADASPIASSRTAGSRVPRKVTPRVSPPVPVLPSRAMREIDDDAGALLEFKRSFSQ